MSQNQNSPEQITGTTIDHKVQDPKLYRVLLHNDDYTTMDFVVQILIEIFHKGADEALSIMISVHQKGIGTCGVFPKEIAEFRVMRVIKRARQAGFPLLCTMEAD